MRRYTVCRCIAVFIVWSVGTGELLLVYGNDQLAIDDAHEKEKQRKGYEKKKKTEKKSEYFDSMVLQLQLFGHTIKC